MLLLVWAGTAVTLGGLATLIWCIATVARARRAGLDDAALKARLQRVVTINLAALLLSALGLMMVVTGVVLS